MEPPKLTSTDFRSGSTAVSAFMRYWILFDLQRGVLERNPYQIYIPLRNPVKRTIPFVQNYGLLSYLLECSTNLFYL